MDDEQAALIRTIAESPDDDAPRLVYCDWLEENGQEERAEFIRLQLRHDAPGERIAEFILTRVQKWREAELPQLLGIGWGNYVRGFVGEMSIYRSPGLISFAAHQEQIMEVAPITRLAFFGFRPAELWYDLRPMPGLREVIIGRFWNDGGSATDFEAITRSPLLTGVRTLSLRFLNLDLEELMPLFRSPVLGSLRVLDLTGNQVRASDLGVLAGSAFLDGLQWLGLSDRHYVADEIRDAVRDAN